jgi:hypothetical protein
MKLSFILFHSCLNCKFFEPSSYDDKYNDLALCHKHIRILENRPYFEKAERMRNREDKCGIAAKYFEPLETSIQNLKQNLKN